MGETPALIRNCHRKGDARHICHEVSLHVDRDIGHDELLASSNDRGRFSEALRLRDPACVPTRMKVAFIPAVALP